jgi:hypothetical protein
MQGQVSDTNDGAWGAKPTPRRKAFRAKLTNTREVAAQAARLFREARAGLIDVQDASRLANILAIVGRLLSDVEIERLNARLDAIEARG